MVILKNRYLIYHRGHRERGKNKDPTLAAKDTKVKIILGFLISVLSVPFVFKFSIQEQKIDFIADNFDLNRFSLI